MNKEIEVKFKIEDIDKLHLDLEEAGYHLVDKVYQKTYSLWDKFRYLSRKGIFIRTRQDGDKHTFTVKTRDLNLKSEYAERNEYNVEVEDAGKVAEMLKIIGFDDMRVLEKYRETWEGFDVDVVIDYTPIGDFMEIEGEKEEIDAFIERFNLNGLPRITMAYWDVYREDCKAKGIDEKNDLVFE